MEKFTLNLTVPRAIITFQRSILDGVCSDKKNSWLY